MKKLVTALALCASFSAFAQVESANVVGYQTKTATGQYFSSGATFISVGSTSNQWKLGDIKLTGSTPQQDIIQFLSVVDANTEITATYVDLAAAGGNAGDVGWYDFTLSTRLDDITFPAGTAFLCNFGSSGVSIMSAGQVLSGPTTLDLSGIQYPFVANLLPMQLTLGSITVAGSTPQQDIFQFLSVTDANTELTATYVDLAAAGGNAGDVGWYDFTLSTRLDDTILSAGAAFLCNLGSPSVSITFPSAL